MKKKIMFIVVSIVILSMAMSACQPAPAPEKVIETVIVEGKVVEKIVEKVVTATPAVKPASGDAKVLTLMSEETSPESQAFYRKAAADFEASHPGVAVILDFPASAADALPIRIAAGSPPDITTMQLEAQLYYADQGLLEPADWWFEKHGDDVVENASVPYKDHYWAIPYALTYEMWWYREDLFKQAGLSRPETWDDMLAAAKKFNNPAKNFYGIAIAAGHSEWTAWHYEVFLWQNGGYVFDTDLKPAVTSKESIEALNFLKELYQYSPPESATWEWWDSIDAFLGETVAMSMYGGRLLVHTARDNPELAPYTRVMLQPLKKIRAHPISRKSHVIMKDSPNKELAKEFIEFIMQEEYLIPFLLTVPVHLTPPLKSLQYSDAYMSHPLIQSHKEDMDLVYEAAQYGRSLGWESPNHPPNPYAGALNNSYILVDMIQKILLQNESPETATKWAEEQILKLQAEVDAGSVK
ncbi:MAG: sugar ABC transporter substrate-binding protein [Anaerolineae bacterium]|nr:sugar ABC transporter substrate-binding protein [Anaerolineae bacterium]